MLLTVAASLKKENGSLSITNDRKSLSWVSSSNPSASPKVIFIEQITGFKQSQADSAKHSVKISIQVPGSSTQDDFIFRFSSDSRAKEDKETFINALSEIISAIKKASGSATGNGTPTPSGAALTGTRPRADSSVPGTPQESMSLLNQSALSDANFLNDLELQKSLLLSDVQLRERFQNSLKQIPSNPASFQQFSAQFWSSRVHLLRAHAAEKNQSQGQYNVLSKVKKTQDNEGVVKLNLSKEQITLIFQQHPLVSRIYNQLVPNQLSEAKFWGKFFGSRLFKKLKGEKITDADPMAPELDRFMNENNDGPQFHIDTMPRFLDLDGNEQDRTGIHGNRADETMRPSTDDRVPILRALNAMSEKMMAHVSASDGETLFGPAGVDERKYEEIRLRDLRNQDEDTRVRLNVTSQQKFLSQNSANSLTNTSLDSQQIMSIMRSNLTADPNLSVVMDETSKAKAAQTTAGILKSIKQTADHLSAHEAPAPKFSESLKASVWSTNDTTNEFLHYFWDVFLSGDDSRAGEVSGLSETLSKSEERMEAVAKEAEKAREDQLKRLREQQEQLAAATGRRRKINMKLLPPGGDVVKSMFSSTDRAVQHATARYREARLEQEAAQANVV